MFWGAALSVALVVGVASMALGANGQPFILGQNNAASLLTKLTVNVDGSAMQVKNTNSGTDDTALNLSVQSGEAPMRVDSAEKVVNLNADNLDGKDADQIGLNGQVFVGGQSHNNSISPKSVVAQCPEGKILVGTGFDLNGGITGDSPNQQTDVMIYDVLPQFNSLTVRAYEETSTLANWSVTAVAVCAKEGAF